MFVQSLSNSTHQSIAPLREVLKDALDLSDLTKRLTAIDYSVSSLDLIPLVLAGEKDRELNKRKQNHPVETTVFWLSVACALRTANLPRAAEAMESFAQIKQQDAASNKSSEAAESATRKLSELVEVKKVIQIILEVRNRWLQELELAVQGKDAQQTITTYSNATPWKVRAMLNHHLANMLVGAKNVVEELNELNTQDNKTRDADAAK